MNRNSFYSCFRKSFFFRNKIFRKELNISRFCSTARGNYGQVSTSDIIFFRNLLGKTNVLTAEDQLDKYNTDWLKSVKGSSPVVLRPKTTNEVSKILSYANHRNLAVCPQGGNTGLVGGSVPIFDEIVISTECMNKILHFDDISGVLSCQAGCVLEQLENFVSEKDFLIPLDLGAKGSCHIGGNVATNAGGVRLVRYGSLHANILGLEVVLADGNILNCMNLMRKDNTGYDLKRLFIGSEGTLGIITQVAILCPPKPSVSAVAILGCHTFKQMLDSAKIIKSKLPEVLSSLEMFDEQAAETVKDNLKITLPIKSHPLYILIEISGSNSIHNEEKLTECLNILMEKDLVQDGTLATESSRIQTIWSVRERITEALLMEGYSYKYDLSLPLTDFYSIVEIMRKRLRGTVTRCCGYGHLGDGNLHFNATTRTFDDNVLKTIEPFVYEWTSQHQGSISAEHGIGYKKRQYLHLYKTPIAIDMMKSLKNLLDPKCILNPYKVV